MESKQVKKYWLCTFREITRAHGDNPPRVAEYTVITVKSPALKLLDIIEMWNKEHKDTGVEYLLNLVLLNHMRLNEEEMLEMTRSGIVDIDHEEYTGKHRQGHKHRERVMRPRRGYKGRRGGQAEDR